MIIKLVEEFNTRFTILRRKKMFDQIDELAVNAVRTLSIDAVQKANSGHPGLPMGAAPMAYALWTKHLKVNP